MTIYSYFLLLKYPVIQFLFLWLIIILWVFYYRMIMECRLIRSFSSIQLWIQSGILSYKSYQKFPLTSVIHSFLAIIFCHVCHWSVSILLVLVISMFRCLWISDDKIGYYPLHCPLRDIIFQEKVQVRFFHHAVF